MARVDELEPAQLLAVALARRGARLGLVAALAVPLIAQDRPLGLVTATPTTPSGPFEDEDLELATVLAANAAVALANARAWRSLEQLNRSLEEAVAARTRSSRRRWPGRTASREELEERNVELEAANRQLRDLERSRATC